MSLLEWKDGGNRELNFNTINDELAPTLTTNIHIRDTL